MRPHQVVEIEDTATSKDQTAASCHDFALDETTTNSENLVRAPIANVDETVIIRGAITVAFDPVIVHWYDTYIPLSYVESEVFAHVARRGRVEVAELDGVLLSIGAKPATRSLVLGHIRQKFLNIGACNPFERLGTFIIRLQVDADRSGNTRPVIGATRRRYATV